MKKERLFAPFLMLLAGAVVSIVMFRSHYETGQLLLVLVPVLIVFYAAGWLIQKQVMGFMAKIKEAEEKEAEEQKAAEEEAKRLAEEEKEAEDENNS